MGEPLKTQQGTATGIEITSKESAELPKSQQSVQILTIAEKTQGQGAFSKWDRAVNQEDLENPAVATVMAKLLLNKCDELERKISYLEDFEKKYHDVDKQCAVLTSKSIGESKFQILYSSSITVAGILIGVATTSGYPELVRGVFAVIGLVMFGLGAFLNWKMNK